jgi:pantoate--beta-alanine ligase
MKVAVELEELRRMRRELKAPFGLVPTMGYLHDGHLSLVRRARQECASVGVSIFVNPTQFAPEEDLDSYPRDLESDLQMLEEEGVDLVWTPTTEVVYPPGAQTWVEVAELTQELEGKQRPGHFRGVTTVVAKLFNAFQPEKAYFGQKDAQQAVVIQRMVTDLCYSIEVVVCPIVREPDGLAMSSRNTYLDPAQRRAATVLSRALHSAKNAFEGGETDAQALRDTMLAVLDAEPLAEVQYVSVADPRTLRELEGEVDQALLSMAVYVGETRLIDNLMLGGKGLVD